MVEATSSSTNAANTSSSSSSTSNARPKVDGLISGIQSSDIIDAFINAERATTRLLERNKSLFEARREAVRTFNTRMLSAQLDLGNLKRASTFQSRTATSSLSDKLAISSTNTAAVPGVYNLDVKAVARAHQIATVGQASSTSSCASGSISLQLGDAPATQITFSAGGSLNDIATAINNSSAGITASIINDGSGSPYRLVLKGGKTGAANDILATGTGGMSSLFTGATTLTAASDAQVRIGSGTPITITQASNTFSDIIPGVTFEARGEADGLTITVAADTGAAKTAVTKFVESFNAAQQYLKANAGFDSATKTAGVLISQSNLVNEMGKITRALTGSIPGAQPPLNNLAAIGISLSKTDGTLTIDQAKLDKVLADNPEGIRKLFMNTGTSNQPAVQFSNLTDKTKITGPFTVDITQPALQSVLNTTDLAASTEINNSNNTLDLLVNGRAVSVTLTNDTYTREELAQHLQSTLASAVNQTTEKINVALIGNKLDIRSDRYGHTQNLQVRVTSTALTALGLSVQNVTGTSVAGTINGVAGTGNGRLLNAAIGSPAEGLSLNVTATTTVSGAQITATKGLGQLIGERFSAMTDNTQGSISTLDKSLSKNISDATKQITRADAMLEKRRARYERQFQSMERMIQQFNSQGTAMTNFVNSLTPKKE